MNSHNKEEGHESNQLGGLTQKCWDRCICRPAARPRGVVGRPGRRSISMLLKFRLC